MTKAGDWKSYQRVLLPPIKNLHHLNVYRDHGGYETLNQVLSQKTPQDVTAEMKRSGLRGRGGAGFPTGLKWSFMPPVDPEKPRYLCCNADESEPGTFKDRQLMEYNPHLLFEGILIAGYAMSLKACYLYVRGEYASWISLMEQELAKAYDAGVVGENMMGTKHHMDIIIHKGAGAYICGEETSLMESLEGKRAYPRIKPPFPAQSGIWNAPTTINNVETLACAPLIIKKGAEWFASIGAEKNPGPLLYGISGHVNRPGVYEYPTGMLITDLLEIAGGMLGGKKLKALVPGGASVPVLRADMIEGVTMDVESLKEAGSMLGTAGMLFLDEDTDMVAFLRRVARFYHHESCGQCTPCREGTGWMENLITRIDDGEGNLRDLDLLLDLCDQMEGRTVCALADAAAWPVRNTIHRFREDFEKRCRPATWAVNA